MQSLEGCMTLRVGQNISSLVEYIELQMGY